MCGCGDTDPVDCARLVVGIGETLRACSCPCHGERTTSIPEPPPVVSRGVKGASKDTREGLVMVLSELAETFGADKSGGPVALLGNALLTVGNFAHDTDDARATAALCFAAADAIRAARKVFGVDC